MAKVVKKVVKKTAPKVAPKAVVAVKVAPVMTLEQIKDRILELRGEMSHYVNESTSVSILALLLFIGAPSVFPEIINPYLPSSLKIMQAIVMIPSVFWLVTILGNMLRYFRILKLQDSLK